MAEKPRQWCECLACHVIAVAEADDQTTCSVCGSSTIRMLSAEQIKESFRSGAFFNLAPPGKRDKAKDL